MSPNLPPPPSNAPLMWQIVPVGAFALIGLLAISSMYLLGAIRAYVGGESLWSKAHTSAVAQLQAHVATGDPAYMQGFEAALSIQIGDQRGREALEARPVQWQAARQGFLAGGIDEADITAMMVLYHLFSDTWLFQPSLRAWIQGDTLIAELRLLAERSRRLTPEQREGPQGLALSREITHVDRQLLAEERIFLSHLTRAAHATEWLLHILVFTSVTLISVIYVLSYRRVHARQRSQSMQLRREQQRWDMAVASAGLGRFDLDIGTLRYHLDARAAQLLGWGEDAITLTREELRTHIHPDDRDEARAQMDQAIAQGVFRLVRYRIVSPEGEVRSIEVAGRMDRDQRQGAHILGIVRDVSVEQMQAQMAIQRDTAQRTAAAQRSFLSRLSHELRTPLNAILGFAQLLDLDQGGPPLSPTQHQQVGWILQSGQQLLGLVDEVLDLSKIESGQVPLQPQEVDVSPLLRGCLPIVESMRERLHITLHDELPAHALPAWADPQRLQQVFINLLSNACKYNRPGGTIQIRTSEDADHLFIEVADTGHGLSSEDIPHLFQPFHRFGPHTKDVEGSGLGLYIARQLMTRMGGDITAQGLPGVGACFTIRLRRHAPHHLSELAADQPVPSGHRWHQAPAPTSEAPPRVASSEPESASILS